MHADSFPSYPARPVNGGALHCALPKIGAWVWQPKVDDWRAIIHAPSGRVWNRHGKPSSVTGKLTAAFHFLRDCPFEWLDAGIMECRNDMMRASLVIFDFFPTNNPSQTMRERRVLLEHEFEILPLATRLLANGFSVRERVLLINQSEGSGLELYQQLQRENATLGRKFYEGVVAKRLDKPYPLQLRSPSTETPWMMKHRFDQ